MKFDVAETQNAMVRDFSIVITLGIIMAIALLGSIYYMIFRLIKEVARAHKTISDMAITDELTGLINRRKFFERLDNEIQRATHYETPMGCLMIDLDHFKSVNDTYGHPTGDALLRMVADTITQTFRENDICARYGGEEFICLLPHTGREGCESCSERLRESIEKLVCPLEDGITLSATCSIGVAMYSKDLEKDTTHSEWLIKRADMALYSAKDNGRNRVVFYE